MSGSSGLDWLRAKGDWAVTDPIEVLRSARHVVVQDFPSQDVPDTLARAGLIVTIYGGPAADDVTQSELVGGSVAHRHPGRYPESADLLCTYRPLDELDAIIAEARRLGARTVWRQYAPGMDAALDPNADTWRHRITQAGLDYVDTPQITEAAQALR